MQVKVTSQDKWRRLIDVQMTAEDLEPHFDKALRGYQKRISMQGFRKGKVPMVMVRKLYGASIKAETIEEMLPDILDDVRKQEGLKPAAPAKIDDFKFEPDNGLHFKVSMDVEPEVELKKYKGLELEKQILEIDDHIVDEQMERLRDRNARVNDFEGPARHGDFVQADVQEVDFAGLPVIGKKYDDRVFLLEKDEAVVGPANDFSSQIVGAKVGEVRKVTITEPQDPAAGKPQAPTYYQVTVKGIKEKILPALDDDFAKGLGKYENLGQLRDDVRRGAEMEASALALRELRNQLMDLVVKENSIDLPESMIEHNLDVLVEGMKKRQDQKIDEQAIRQEYRAGTIWNIKWRLLKAKLIAQEGIVADNKEVEKFAHAVAQMNRKTPQREWARIKNNPEELERMRDDVLEDKLIQHLITQQTIREKKVTHSHSQKSNIIV